ncbi:MAG: hypothetical protein LBH14_03420 [Desulfobulbaceae bacterium]|jgi:pyruvate,water dikinase|nr:hypothetical protein [Desulfobulbaceae bacterium]
MNQYVVDFDNPEAESLEQSGGKGANLAKLKRAGFPVPPGFIVTSRGYADFIGDRRQIEEAIAALPFGHPEKLVAAARELRATLSALPLPEAVASEVRTALRKAGKGAYSVRSSSTLEDLAGAAFAGQHDTYLNCSGEDEILSKIRDCFVSLWQDRAISYRHSKGFAPQMATMAVVVQKMVQCQVAGVGFSIDPISGKNTMLINSNYGLGESVVSGEAEVDQFVIDRDSRKIVDSFIAKKTVKIISDGAQGTKGMAPNAEESLRPSLDEQQIAAIADLMLRVEGWFRFPQDIEWGMEKGALYLLQSRPITSIAPRWTRDESAERYPTAMTPLPWDLIEEGFHKSIEYSFKLMGFPPFDGKWFAMFDNYIYGDQNAVRFYLGALPFTPIDAESLRAGISEFAKKNDWALTLPSEWMRGLDRYLLRLGALNSEPLGKTPAELWDYILRVSAGGEEYFRPNIAISITQSVLYRSLLGFIKIFAPEKAISIFDRLTAYCETKTSLVNRELKKLAELAGTEKNSAGKTLAELMRGSRSNALLTPGMLDNYPNFHQAFRRFLQDHGHREVEVDPYIPTWSGAPWVVLDNIKLILNAPAREDDMQVKKSASEAESELFAILPEDLHLFFREIIRLVRLYTELDDVEHYQTTRLHLPIRRGLEALGTLLAERGIVNDPLDVFFARKATLEACVNRERTWENLGEEIRANKEAYQFNRTRSPQWVLGEEANTASSGDDNELNGLAGSPGIAEGPAFIIESSDDFALFPHRAVLVARTTNPAWTPLFYAAAALVTESGGPLSHGAVTAREMKIPAVMSVRGVMNALKNGDRIRVDGGRGKVYMAIEK